MPFPEALDGHVIDGHVHLMPQKLMAAIRKSLTEEAGWSFEHPTDRERMEEKLRSMGVERYVALPYAHKRGMARELNEWVLTRSRESEMAIPFATVHGDDDVAAVVREAFEAGARGLKFQCPVQGCGPADPRLDPAFEAAAEYDKPILFHAGTAPMFEDSPHVGAEKFAEFVESYPEIRACAAHMGTFETGKFLNFARDHENVFLDTTMALSPRSADVLGFDADGISDETLVELAESVQFGTDFPNVPYPYEDERRGLLERELPASVYEDLFRNTAERFLGER
ncbi:amidohydrolase family protein [Haladaptatus sp. AB643]|uniref:amidohydrolase family protein n=1 Tax=Haladaptatus sp. AB643 TaxID=2934174 RepID=UPI00209BCCCD|nr:amidohydrolase family protein [Haladaptatus sp. AB643]MCO8245760.1 amidohydrolase [Haladaptatus sp. AB643]